MPRPPLKTARAAAVKRLLTAHADELELLVTEELENRGWHQETVSTTRWVGEAKPGRPPT